MHAQPHMLSYVSFIWRTKPYTRELNHILVIIILWLLHTTVRILSTTAIKHTMMNVPMPTNRFGFYVLKWQNMQMTDVVFSNKINAKAHSVWMAGMDGSGPTLYFAAFTNRTNNSTVLNITFTQTLTHTQRRPYRARLAWIIRTS